MEADRWLGVELRHLAALQAIAAEGSFGRAAQRLGYTQSAVSQQIATLERIVGERLLERPGGPRPVSLTEAGMLLLRHAEAIVARLEAAQADLDALSSGAAGTLRVGTYQSVGRRILPIVMRRFAAAWPQVELRLTAHHRQPRRRAGLPVPERVEVGLRRRQPRDDRLRVPEQQLAGLGERDLARAARPVDELLADKALQRRDLLRDRRLRVPERKGRLAERRLTSDRLQRDQVTKLDALPAVEPSIRFHDKNVSELDLS